MRSLVMMVMVGLLAAAPAGATTLFWEDFEGTVGNDISTLGWTDGDTGGANISATVIDSGKSAIAAGVSSAPLYRQNLAVAHTLGLGEYYVYTGVLEATGDDAYVYMVPSAGTFVYVRLDDDNNLFLGTESGAEEVSANTGVSKIYFKMTTDAASTTLEYGATSALGSLLTDANSGIGSFSSTWLRVGGFNGSTGAAMDSLKLDVVPEPATVALLAVGGLAGLLRRRP
jgi:hypothetical protein